MVTLSSFRNKNDQEIINFDKELNQNNGTVRKKHEKYAVFTGKVYPLNKDILKKSSMGNDNHEIYTHHNVILKKEELNRVNPKWLPVMLNHGLSNEKGDSHVGYIRNWRVEGDYLVADGVITDEDCSARLRGNQINGLSINYTRDINGRDKNLKFDSTLSSGNTSTGDETKEMNSGGGHIHINEISLTTDPYFQRCTISNVFSKNNTGEKLNDKCSKKETHESIEMNERKNIEEKNAQINNEKKDVDNNTTNNTAENNEKINNNIKNENVNEISQKETKLDDDNIRKVTICAGIVTNKDICKLSEIESFKDNKSNNDDQNEDKENASKINSQENKNLNEKSLKDNKMEVVTSSDNNENSINESSKSNTIDNKNSSSLKRKGYMNSEQEEKLNNILKNDDNLMKNPKKIKKIDDNNNKNPNNTNKKNTTTYLNHIKKSNTHNENYNFKKLNNNNNLLNKQKKTYNNILTQNKSKSKQNTTNNREDKFTQQILDKILDNTQTPKTDHSNNKMEMLDRNNSTQSQQGFTNHHQQFHESNNNNMEQENDQQQLETKSNKKMNTESNDTNQSSRSSLNNNEENNYNEGDDDNHNDEKTEDLKDEKMNENEFQNEKTNDLSVSDDENVDLNNENVVNGLLNDGFSMEELEKLKTSGTYEKIAKIWFEKNKVDEQNQQMVRETLMNEMSSFQETMKECLGDSEVFKSHSSEVKNVLEPLIRETYKNPKKSNQIVKFLSAFKSILAQTKNSRNTNDESSNFSSNDYQRLNKMHNSSNHKSIPVTASRNQKNTRGFQQNQSTSQSSGINQLKRTNTSSLPNNNGVSKQRKMQTNLNNNNQNLLQRKKISSLADPSNNIRSKYQNRDLAERYSEDILNRTFNESQLKSNNSTQNQLQNVHQQQQQQQQQQQHLNDNNQNLLHVAASKDASRKHVSSSSSNNEESSDPFESFMLNEYYIKNDNFY
jgi:hypothetical protein